MTWLGKCFDPSTIGGRTEKECGLLQCRRRGKALLQRRAWPVGGTCGMCGTLYRPSFRAKITRLRNRI